MEFNALGVSQTNGIAPQRGVIPEPRVAVLRAPWVGEPKID